MDKLFIAPTSTTPEIFFSIKDNLFRIKGNSRPEDVRALYYPVTEWITNLIDGIISGRINDFTEKNPIKFQFDLQYFNSSSAKFLYDIFLELKKLPDAGKHVNIEWYYEREDTDMFEAGSDMASLVSMNFSFIAKEEE